jgi:hypothetical protein
MPSPVQLTNRRRCTDRIFPSCASTPCERTPALLLCCRTEPSPPFLSPCAIRVAPTQGTTIKGGHPIASRLHQRSYPPPSCLTSASTTSLMPSRLTHFPSSCIGPGGSPELGAAPRATGPPPSPSLSFGAVDRTGELHVSVARPPHCELVLWTMSGGCVMTHGCAPWAPSCRTADCHLAPPAPCHALYVSPPRHVGGAVGRPHAALGAAPGLAAPRRCQATHAAHSVRVGQPLGFQPVESFLNRNSFSILF